MDMKDDPPERQRNADNYTSRSDSCAYEQRIPLTLCWTEVAHVTAPGARVMPRSFQLE